jgi:PAS domain S-box-containing protein
MILRQLLGRILTDMGFVTLSQLQEALGKQKKMFEIDSIPEKLDRAGLVSEARRATEAHTQPLLGKILTDLGFITSAQLSDAIRAQQKMVEVYRSLDSDKLGVAIEVGSIVNSSLNLAEVLTMIMRHANEVTNSVASTLMLLDEDNRELVFSVPTGPKADQLTDIRIPFGKGIAGWVAEHEESVLVPDVKKDPRFYHVIDKISGFETKSILCVPLKWKTRLIGVLEVINKADGSMFTEQDRLILSIFAHQAAMAVENARLYSELKERVAECLVNIQERRQAEEALRTGHEELEKRISERTGDLMQMNEMLRLEIEERKKTEKALEKSKEQYKELIEKLSDVFFTTEKNGIINYINPAIETLIGLAPSKVIGRHFMEIIHDADKPVVAEAIRKTLFGNDEKTECRIRTDTDEIRWVRTSIQPVYVGKKVIGLRGMLTDITQSKMIQEQLIQSERFAATGQLAASIAHEINSPLQAVAVLLKTMKTASDGDEEYQKNMDLLRDGFERIRNTVKNLLDLSRPGDEYREPTQINQIIRATVALLNTQLKKSRVKVNLQLSPKIPTLVASPQQMGQLFMNLLNNAVEALDGTTDPHERWMSRTAGGKEISIQTSYTKGKVVITFADNGPGIAEKDLEHIFDPFFTRKKRMGMGLGLSICYKIVEDHLGTIQAANLPDGKGVSFTIKLPTD